MLNRPINPLRTRTDVGPRWESDRRPGLRMVALFAVLLAAVSTIGMRLVQVQTQLGSEYSTEFDRTWERFEPIATHDGRILSADGQVLAEDVEEFSLAVHYRWLEDPPDPAWIRQQALSRLDRAARRKPEQIAAEEASLLARRQELWKRLKAFESPDRPSVDPTRKRIQKRVEHIYQTVLSRLESRAEDQGSTSAPTSPPGTWWETTWQTVVATLTTPPQREADEPLVVREQLDYHTILPEIALETAVEIEAHPERYPGTRVETRMRRSYPQGDSAAHLVGYRTVLQDEEITSRREGLAQNGQPLQDPLDYRPGDRKGRSGLERQYERHLRGLRGERKVVFNRRGELVRSEVVREPRFGTDLSLSLNLSLQRAAEQLLDEQLREEHLDEVNGKPLPIPPGGAIVALDVRTGAVLAAASAPRFDLKLFAGGGSDEWERALADERKPLFHRAAEMALPPGSVFKVASAVAFLESGRLDPEHLFHCQGFLDTPERYRCFTFRNFGVGHGDVALVDALARSCNVYFFDAARRIGPAPLHDWAAKFGFGQKTGLDLPAENAGNLPGLPDAPRSRNAKPKASGETLQLAIGQAKLTATPLQIARFIASIANGGRLVTPRLADAAGLAAVNSADSDESDSSASEAPRIAGLSSRSLEWVRMGLRQVVAHPQGTGYKTVRLQGISIAGKTGTAEPGQGRPDHAWFAGYVPAERPRVAFVVVLEHAGSGGHAAGPVAREFVQALVALGLLDGPPIASPAAN